MKWSIERICAKEESVFLIQEESGTLRQISVPGAEDAWVESGFIMIRSRTGYVWEVEPDTCARRRMMADRSN